MLKKLLGSGTRFKLVQPGTDPLEDPISYKHNKMGCGTLMMVVSGIGLAVLLGVKFLGGAQAKQAPTLTPTATATATATPTASLVPTLTGTTTGPVAGAFSNVQLPGTRQPTGQPGVMGLATVVVVQTKIVVVQGQGVEVTKIVYQTMIVTATPGPTQTPWIITVEVTQTHTPMATQTATVQPTPNRPPTEIPVEFPSPVPSATPTAPGYPYPAP